MVDTPTKILIIACYASLAAIIYHTVIIYSLYKYSFIICVLTHKLAVFQLRTGHHIRMYCSYLDGCTARYVANHQYRLCLLKENYVAHSFNDAAIFGVMDSECVHISMYIQMTTTTLDF